MDVIDNSVDVYSLVVLGQAIDEVGAAENGEAKAAGRLVQAAKAQAVRDAASAAMAAAGASQDDDDGDRSPVT
jgi:hypothetical protein